MFNCAKYEYWCDQRGKSYSTFPIECGACKSTSSYTSWTNGTEPSKKTIKALADGLEINVSDLCDEKKEPIIDEDDGSEKYEIPNSKITLQEYNRQEFLQLKSDMLDVIETLKIAAGVQNEFDNDDALIIKKLRELPKEKQTIARKIFHDILSSFSEKGDW